jgi:hypothetical protein
MYSEVAKEHTSRSKAANIAIPIKHGCARSRVFPYAFHAPTAEAKP